MTIDFLGYGGAFDPLIGNSAAVVSIGRERLLVDAGFTVYPTLRQRNLADSITGILITHTHDDHIGSLGAIAMHRRYVMGWETKMPLYAPAALQERLQALLRFTLSNPDKYIDWQPAEALEGVTAIETTGFHVPGLPSYAYAFHADGKTLVYSGDIADSNLILRYCRQQNWLPELVFHDCTFVEANSHHAYYMDLQQLDAPFPIIGYHCDPAHKPLDCTLPLVGENGLTSFSVR